MSYADAPLPREHVDAKRIAATSGAIALHLAVLMMLMMPATPMSIDTKEKVTVVDWIQPPKPLTPIPPPKPMDKPKPAPAQDQPQIAIKDDVVEAVDQTATAVSTQADDSDQIANTFNVDPPQSDSPFQQLSVAVGPAPTYPKPAILRHMEGTVMLRIHVDPAGKPIEVSVEQSSGSRILDEAAVEFVRKRWLFVPAQQNGQAVDAWGLLPIQFTLQ